MAGRLDGRLVAFLVADGFEQFELTSPRAALEGAGARTFIVSPRKIEIVLVDGAWIRMHEAVSARRDPPHLAPADIHRAVAETTRHRTNAAARCRGANGDRPQMMKEEG